MTEPAGLQDFECACATARQLARVLTQLYDRHLDGAGIEAPQFALLATLQGHGPATQQALGRRHGLDKTTVSRNVALLRRRKWVAVSVAADRRHRRLQITEAGRRILRAASPRWSAAQSALRQSMSASEWKTLFTALRTTARAAQALHDRVTTEAPATGSSRTRRR
jgi:DNA-binding MarR family transcriptional regulator